MKRYLTLLGLILGAHAAQSQIAVDAIDTSIVTAPSSFTYTNNGNTYNWGVSPNNTLTTLFGFNAGSKGYVYLDTLKGTVKLRRVDNAVTSGNLTLEWVQTITNGTTFNMFPSYINNMDTFLTGNTYNKGTDNLFDNQSANSNNIERLDWVLSAPYSTPAADQTGVAVFDKGNPGTHDPFCIAAITSVDGAGDPLTYGNIVRVAGTNYGDPGPSITYRILKGKYPDSLLLTAGTNTQNIGGVFITLSSLGIAADSPVFGYSLFSSDLPTSATPADLLDYNNPVFFPTNTSTIAGGLDLVAVTGFNIAISIILPVNFLNFNAVDDNDKVKLVWSVENETPYQKYDIERSEDGLHFYAVSQAIGSGNSTSGSYSFVDDVASLASNHLYYRIKQYEAGGSYHYSKVVPVNRNGKTSAILIYPNPVQQSLFLNIPSTGNDKVLITIFNAAGARVLQMRESITRGINSFTLENLNKFPKGIYQLSLKKLGSGTTVTRQFTKQ